MKKYVLYGGWVRSSHDGQDHFISALQLCRLYRLKFSDCILVDDLREEYKLLGLDRNKLIPLYPSQSGNYQLPEIKS